MSIEAAAAMQQQQQAGATNLASKAYPAPKHGAAPDEVLDYFVQRYGQLIPELHALRSRVWQLEQVLDNNLQRRHEAVAVIEQLRMRVEQLEGDVEDREERIKAMAPDEQFEVVGVYTASNKGVSREVKRTLSHLAVASFDGKTTITVDLRAKGRKRAGSSNSTP